jgi:hypothetical protein
MALGRVVTLLSLALLLPYSATAQPNALNREHRNSVLLEGVHPDLQGGLTDLSWSTGAALIAARHRFSPGFAAVVDLPISHYDWTERQVVGYDSTGYVYGPGGIERSGTSMGNPYVGVEFMNGGNSPWIIEAGIRPNVINEPRPELVGVAVDLSRWEAFMGGTTSFRTGFRVHTDLSGKTSGTFRGAVISLVSGESSDLEFYGGATGVRKLGAWFVSPALDTRVLTELNVSDRLVTQLELAVGHEGPHTRTQVFARYYLDSDWNDAVSWSLGLSCGAF